MRESERATILSARTSKRLRKNSALCTNGKGTSSTRAAKSLKMVSRFSACGVAIRVRKDFFRRLLSSNAMPAPTIVEVEGRKLSLTNLDKVLYPTPGFTKGQVVDYYARIAPVLVPHLAGRPLTMKRYPGGVNDEFFFEKNAPKHRPDWVNTTPVWSEGNNRTMHYLVVNDLPTLIWIANLASIELHPSLSLGAELETPTMIVFDLDPGPPANIVQCCQVGVWVREIFEHFGLRAFAKTSGSKGLQIYVPLNTKTSYDQTKPFARAIAQLARAAVSRSGRLRYEEGAPHK